MVSAEGEGDGPPQEGKALRLLGYLKANKKVAYVLTIMVLVHLSNQYDRRVDDYVCHICSPQQLSQGRRVMFHDVMCGCGCTCSSRMGCSAILGAVGLEYLPTVS